MKTSLACLGILIVALIFGQRQGARIATLEQRISSARTVRPTKASRNARQDQVAAYRTNYVRRPSSEATAASVFQQLLSSPDSGGAVIMGPQAALENREVMQTLMQLDRAELEKLIQLISRSESPVFQRPFKSEKIILCLVAMADLDPRLALSYVTGSKERFGQLFDDDWLVGTMLNYVIVRMSDRDPQGALATLIEHSEGDTGASQEQRVRELMGKIVLKDPGPVLDALEKLPEAQRSGIRDSFGILMETDEERMALFQAARERYGAQPAAMKGILTTLCKRFQFTRESALESRKWVESLGMTDPEKLLAFDGLRGLSVPPEKGEEFTKWFAKFMPESDERRVLVWKTSWMWAQEDGASAKAFLLELRIDGEEMIRLEMGGN